MEFNAPTFVSRSPSGARSVHGSSQSATGVWYPVTTLTAFAVGGLPDLNASRPAIRDSNSSSARANSASNRSPTDRGDMVRSTQALNSVTSACLPIIADWSPRFIARCEPCISRSASAIPCTSGRARSYIAPGVRTICRWGTAIPTFVKSAIAV